MGEVIVEVEEGKLRGKSDVNYNGGTFYTFHAIPFAKPPLGELRFKAPQPPEPWIGIRDATAEADPCYARDFFQEMKFVGSEDCLYLNVYTPKLPQDKNPLKPVMFYIYGGGFLWGSSKKELYNPEYLLTEDVVLVTINYRLGILGFLAVEDPISGVTGNAAFKDMVMALKWVQKNISRFGGDPNNVTIFGESAGSMAAHCVVLSPMAKGLFHRAILQSGSALSPSLIGSLSTATVAKSLGYEGQDALKYLQSLSVEKILQVQESFVEDFHYDKLRQFGATIENSRNEPMFLSQHPLDILKSGHYNKVPLIFGYTSKEGAFIEMDTFSSIKNFGYDFETKIPHYFNLKKGSELSLAIANKIKKGYYGSSEPSADNMTPQYNLETDCIMYRGIYKSIKLHKLTSNQPVYLYRFSADADRNMFKKSTKVEYEGACHADDIPYLFATQYAAEMKKDSLEERIMQRIVKLWTNFARTGDPNPKDKDALIRITWQPVEDNCLHCLEMGNELSYIADPEKERMKIWDEIAALVANA